MTTNPPTTPPPAHPASPDQLAPIRRLHEHKRFALDDFLTALEPLTPDQLHHTSDIGMGSLIATAAHCLAADRVWIDALQGIKTTPLLTPEDCPDTQTARRTERELNERWHPFLTQLKPADLPRPISRTTAATGETYTITTLDIILHVATHQAHTIAQGRNMLRKLDITPLSRNDLVFWAINRPIT